MLEILKKIISTKSLKKQYCFITVRRLGWFSLRQSTFYGCDEDQLLVDVDCPDEKPLIIMSTAGNG